MPDGRQEGGQASARTDKGQARGCKGSLPLLSKSLWRPCLSSVLEKFEFLSFCGQTQWERSKGEHLQGEAKCSQPHSTVLLQGVYKVDPL